MPGCLPAVVCMHTRLLRCADVTDVAVESLVLGQVLPARSDVHVPFITPAECGLSLISCAGFVLIALRSEDGVPCGNECVSPLSSMDPLLILFVVCTAVPAKGARGIFAASRHRFRTSCGRDFDRTSAERYEGGFVWRHRLPGPYDPRPGSQSA